MAGNAARDASPCKRHPGIAASVALVVDTSVAIKWIVEEEGSEAALALQGAELAAPALFCIEAANLLRSLVAPQQVPAA